MATPLNEQLRTAAAANAGLVALLGSDPFRWWFDTLRQGSAFPAIVQFQVSSQTAYVATARLATGWSRQQFTIWGGRFDAGEAARQAVAEALKAFLDTFSIIAEVVNRSTGAYSMP
jgi:hypothetical protein